MTIHKYTYYGFVILILIVSAKPAIGLFVSELPILTISMSWFPDRFIPNSLSSFLLLNFPPMTGTAATVLRTMQQQ